jgi:hypothetical protein
MVPTNNDNSTVPLEYLRPAVVVRRLSAELSPDDDDDISLSFSNLNQPNTNA